MTPLDQLEAAMAAPDYRPILARPSVVARMFDVTPSAVSNWAARSERTGITRYPDGQFDVNAVARWVLIRDQAQANRRTGVTPSDSGPVPRRFAR